MGSVAATDEGRHAADRADLRWEESWDFDFTTGAADLGGYFRIALHPGLATTWFWAALVGDGRPLVTVVDHEVAFPRGPGLDLRADGLWADAVCETPLDHWTLGMEAFGVALDDPAEAYRSGRGDRTALGLDLEWESTGPAVEVLPGRYHLPCAVHGEVLVGREVIAFDGWGGRSHAWGRRSWWDRAWCTTTGRLDDGTTWHADCAGASAAGDHLPGPGRLALVEHDLDLAVVPRHHAPVLIDGPDGRTSHLVRSLCVYTTADGRSGAGWTEWNQPQ